MYHQDNRFRGEQFLLVKFSILLAKVNTCTEEELHINKLICSYSRPNSHCKKLNAASLLKVSNNATLMA